MKTQTQQQILDSGITTNSGAEIFSVTGLPAESAATLHAMNSRQPGGFRANLPKMFTKKGLPEENVLGLYYIGYGHQSIGDCGHADVYVDNVSMLVANAFEHWPLFRGQETSSRYVDVTSNGYHLPESLRDGKDDDWMEKWMDFYSRVQKALVEKIRKENPFECTEKCPEDVPYGKWYEKKEKEWESATRARSFDIAGAFLPCGARTNFSGALDLRQWSDLVQILQHHPLDEVRDAANTVHKLLLRDYPNSFKEQERPEKVAYNKAVAKKLFVKLFNSNQDFFYAMFESDGFIFRAEEYGLQELLEKRSFRYDLPHSSSTIGRIRFGGPLDYRSFRDLHRHRPITWLMPIVSPEWGFEQWYLDQLPEEFVQEAEEMTRHFFDWWCNVDADISTTDLQYITPMGFKVPIEAVAPFNAAVYMAELRSGPKVHPTARRFAIALGEFIENSFPGYKFYISKEPDKFCLSRGGDDIVERGKE